MRGRLLIRSSCPPYTLDQRAPLLQTTLGLRGTLLLTAGVAVAGFALTLVLPEPAGRSLEDLAAGTHDPAARPLRVVDQASAS